MRIRSLITAGQLLIVPAAMPAQDVNPQIAHILEMAKQIQAAPAK